VPNRDRPASLPQNPPAGGWQKKYPEAMSFPGGRAVGAAPRRRRPGKDPTSAFMKHKPKGDL